MNWFYILVRRNKTMFTPDKFLIDAINDVKNGNNVLVVAPTGSGKTYIAEKSVDHYLSIQKNVFYAR